jgi:hypothetical protein
MWSTHSSWNLLIKHEFSRQLFEKSRMSNFSRLHSVGVDLILADLQTDRETDKQTERRTDERTDRQTDTIKIIVSFHNFGNAPKDQYLNRSRGNFRKVVLTFYGLFNDDANACYCRVWTELEKLWTKLPLPNWRYHPGFGSDWGKPQRRLPHPKFKAGTSRICQKRSATASVLHIIYLSHNCKCPKNNAISM